MDTLCFFNNKGGVGKTTLLCNVAAYIAEKYDLKVVLVDADPQCNATQLVLDELQLENLYSPSKIKIRKKTTILDILRPLNRGEPQIDPKLNLVPGGTTRFSFDLLPGHPRLALLEDRLSQSWVAFSSGDLGGARQSNWNSQLVAALSKKYDLALFDVGPSLGALNRSVLVGADFFVTPMGCDIFSIVGVENISVWLKDWLGTYKQALRQCKQKGWEGELKRFHVRGDIDEIARFTGYTVQQYIAKMEGGKRRPTLQFERIRQKVPNAVDRALSRFLAPHLGSGDMDLGDVPNMFSLVPMAQSAHAPIHRLESGDGLVGAQYSQRDKYAGFVAGLSTALLKNLDYRV